MFYYISLFINKYHYSSYIYDFIVYPNGVKELNYVNDKRSFAPIKW